MKIVQIHVAPTVDAVGHEATLSCVCGTSNTYGFAPNGDIEIRCLHHPLAAEDSQ